MSLPPLICGACVQCCKGPGRALELHPDDDPNAYRTLTTVDGRILLDMKGNGDCTYLGEHGCSIYPDRPIACRRYDCRLLIDHPDVPERIKVEAVRRVPTAYVVKLVNLLSKKARTLDRAIARRKRKQR